MREHEMEQQIGVGEEGEEGEEREMVEEEHPGNLSIEDVNQKYADDGVAFTSVIGSVVQPADQRWPKTAIPEDEWVRNAAGELVPDEDEEEEGVEEHLQQMRNVLARGGVEGEEPEPEGDEGGEEDEAGVQQDGSKKAPKKVIEGLCFEDPPLNKVFTSGPTRRVAHKPVEWQFEPHTREQVTKWKGDGKNWPLAKMKINQNIDCSSPASVFRHLVPTQRTPEMKPSPEEETYAEYIAKWSSQKQKDRWAEQQKVYKIEDAEAIAKTGQPKDRKGKDVYKPPVPFKPWEIEAYVAMVIAIGLLGLRNKSISTLYNPEMSSLLPTAILPRKRFENVSYVFCLFSLLFFYSCLLIVHHICICTSYL